MEIACNDNALAKWWCLFVPAMNRLQNNKQKTIKSEGKRNRYFSSSSLVMWLGRFGGVESKYRWTNNARSSSVTSAFYMNVFEWFEWVILPSKSCVNECCNFFPFDGICRPLKFYAHSYEFIIISSLIALDNFNNFSIDVEWGGMNSMNTKNKCHLWNGITSLLSRYIP